MKKVLLVISLFFINVFFAQTNNIKLMGSVVDSLTNEPLEYVNVYLSNTSLGTSTLTNGTFTINRIPAGEYIVYFSCIGYKPTRKTININRHSVDLGKVKLTKHEFELEELAVVGEKQTEWEKRLKRFTSLLLGESELSKSCKIINPEVIGFVEEEGKIKINTNSLVKVENKMLGFEIKLDFQYFEWDDKNLVFSYSLFPYFSQKKPEKEQDILEWYKNRQKAYLGSTRHFFVSLIQNRLLEEGFRVIQGINEKDNLIEKEFRTNGTKNTQELHDLIIVVEDSNLYRIRSKEGYLVQYLNAKTEYDYHRYNRFYQYPLIDDSNQMSIINFTTNFFRITGKGTQFQTGNFYLMGGYWTYCGLGNFLPYDYEPNESFAMFNKRIRSEIK